MKLVFQILWVGICLGMAVYCAAQAWHKFECLNKQTNPHNPEFWQYDRGDK